MPNSKKYSYYIDTEKFFQERNKPIPEKYIIEITPEELGVITDPAVANQVARCWRDKR